MSNAMEAAREYLELVEQRKPFEAPEMDCYTAEQICRALLSRPVAGDVVEALRELLADRKELIDFLFSACDVSNWDCGEDGSPLYKGETFAALRDAYDGVASLAGEYLGNDAENKATAALALSAEAPDGGAKRYERLKGSFTELQAAAQFVVDETDRIHDTSPWPAKYRAPYDAITKLRALLAQQYGLRSPPPQPAGDGT